MVPSLSTTASSSATSSAPSTSAVTVCLAEPVVFLFNLDSATDRRERRHQRRWEREQAGRSAAAAASLTSTSALPGGFVLEKNAADFAGLLVEGIGRGNVSEVVANVAVTRAVGALCDGVSWRLGGEVDVLRVYHLELGLGVDLLNDVFERPVRLTFALVDLGGHREKLSELDGRTNLVVF